MTNSSKEASQDSTETYLFKANIYLLRIRTKRFLYIRGLLLVGLLLILKPFIQTNKLIHGTDMNYL